MQALVNGLNAEHQRQRAETQMTLGGLIETLEAIEDKARVVTGFGKPHSYRGYYTDLSFGADWSDNSDECTVAELLERARGCMGVIFEGYKGGEYVMGAVTPIWLANYGSCGLKVMALDVDSDPIKAITAEDEF
jgi:hypothetical protein